MALREEFERVGNWLFRWRSYLPLILIGLFLLALRHFYYLSGNYIVSRSWEIMCLFISLSGLAVRMYAVGCAPRGTSGRNVTEQRAHSLNTTGIYSLIRHPLYFGNFLIWIGVALSIGSLWFAIVIGLVFWFYYEKIMFAEEEFLRGKFGDGFQKWAGETPVFLPLRLKLWRPPELPFEFRNALRREYSGFFGIISVFSLLRLIKDIMVERKLIIDPIWLSIFLFGLAVYVALQFLKKKTHLLDVEGR